MVSLRVWTSMRVMSWTHTGNESANGMGSRRISWCQASIHWRSRSGSSDIPTLIDSTTMVLIVQSTLA